MSIDFDLDRDPVEQIAELFLDEIRRGEAVTVDSYASDYPEHSDAIRALFPTLLAMEDAKNQAKRTPNAIEDTDPLLARHLNKLGDFRILRRIGNGGMGVVYEAEQESLGRKVAVKVLSPSLVTTPKQIARFRRESHAAASLHHGNIVPVFGVGEQWGIHYYIMQRIHGCGLDELLKQTSQRKPENQAVCSRFQLDDFDEIARIGTRVADALSYAHEQGILHRDIKPANIMLDENGVPWVMDFGLAKSLEGSSEFTQTGHAVGTLRYMPPEQFRGNADERSDVYSLGITLYELLTRTPAFGGSNRSRLIESISSGKLTRPSLLNNRVPRDLETIVLKAVAPEPKHRYQSARDMADDLQRFADDLPIQARRASVLDHAWRWSRKNPALAAACASLILLLVTMTARSNFAYWRIQDALTQEKVEK
ncbi:MAG: serine/threonine-protein kinase, partial [Planctomycetota bacterium]